MDQFPPPMPPQDAQGPGLVYRLLTAIGRHALLTAAVCFIAVGVGFIVGGRFKKESYSAEGVLRYQQITPPDNIARLAKPNSLPTLASLIKHPEFYRIIGTEFTLKEPLPLLTRNLDVKQQNDLVILKLDGWSSGADAAALVNRYMDLFIHYADRLRQRDHAKLYLADAQEQREKALQSIQLWTTRLNSAENATTLAEDAMLWIPSSDRDNLKQKLLRHEFDLTDELREEKVARDEVEKTRGLVPRVISENMFQASLNTLRLWEGKVKARRIQIATDSESLKNLPTRTAKANLQGAIEQRDDLDRRMGTLVSNVNKLKDRSDFPVAGEQLGKLNETEFLVQTVAEAAPFPASSNRKLLTAGTAGGILAVYCSLLLLFSGRSIPTLQRLPLPQLPDVLTNGQNGHLHADPEAVRQRLQIVLGNGRRTSVEFTLPEPPVVEESPRPVRPAITAGELERKSKDEIQLEERFDKWLRKS